MSVASQAWPEVSPATGGEHGEMGGVGAGSLRSSPAPCVPTVAPMPEIVRAQALLIHGIDYRHGRGAW